MMFLPSLFRRKSDDILYSRNMRIPPDAEISRDKLENYLLVHRPWDDKSRFLARAGFDRSNWAKLEQAIRQLAARVEAVENGRNEYGVFWRIEGELIGPAGGGLPVAVIWIERLIDGGIHLVTLKPLR